MSFSFSQNHFLNAKTAKISSIWIFLTKYKYFDNTEGMIISTYPTKYDHNEIFDK